MTTKEESIDEIKSYSKELECCSVEYYKKEDFYNFFYQPLNPIEKKEWDRKEFDDGQRFNAEYYNMIPHNHAIEGKEIIEGKLEEVWYEYEEKEENDQVVKVVEEV